MKRYNETMEQLRFSENFCEETIRNAKQTKKNKKLPRAWVTAACICLCSVLLFTTAWAVSPEFRSIFIETEHAETTETVNLPQAAGTVSENSIGSITARYYKLDGALEAHDGLGSLLPVEKDGVMTYYALAEEGSLQKAEPIRSIKKTLEYKGFTFVLDMDIYGGDRPSAVMDDRVVPLADENTYTIWHELKPNIMSPLVVDLQTWQINDPLANVDFNLPEGAYDASVSVPKESELLLASCIMKDDSLQYYCINTKNGEVVALDNSDGRRWFVCEKNIYSHYMGTLSKLNEAYELEALLENCEYTVGTRYVHLFEGEDMVLFEIATEKRYIIENGREAFSSNPIATANADGTKIKLTNCKLDGYGLNTDAIAIIDLQQGKTFSLERKAGMREGMSGWLDNDRFLIAGRLGEDWYVCMYEIG